MKKTIFLTLCVLVVSRFAFAQFTSDNIAVYRYGDGAPLVNGAKVPVFIDEYNPRTGQKVRSIAISRTATGSNYGIEGIGLNSQGAYETEGFPVLSRDGETLSVFGHNPASVGSFVIGNINSTGQVIANTGVVDNIGAPRSAVVEGNAVYFNGYQNGVRYKTLGNDDPSVRVSASQAAPRILTLAETIYGTNEGLRLFAPVGGTGQQVLASTSPLPTTSVSFTTSPNFPGSAKPFNVHQAIAFKAYGRTILYIIDDGDANGTIPRIRKYRSNAGGSDWLELGSVSVPVTTKNITGRFDANGIKLYFTALGTAGNQDSRLYVLNDDFTVTNNESKRLDGISPVLVATADVNTTFRGVTLVPGYRIAPSALLAEVVSLTEVKLSWADNSTTESGFQIERSTDGTNFTLLTTVSQNIVEYTDNTVTAGTTYYYRVRGIEGSSYSIYANTVSVMAASGMISDLNFTSRTVYENEAIGTSVGTFSVLPSTTVNVTYSLVAGTGDDDNAKFKISGNELQNNVILDFEEKAIYNVRVRATSPSNYTHEETLQITIHDVNEAPTITAIGNQNTCVGTEEKVIPISGITAGPESGQTVTASITSDNPQLFESLTVNLTGNGDGEIKYKLNNNSPGEVKLSLKLQDDGGTAHGGVDTHTEEFMLKINDFPTVSIISDQGNTVDKGITVKLTASGGETYQWQNAEGIIGATNNADLLVRPDKTTVYSVTVTNGGGCSSTMQFTLSLKDNYDLVIVSNLLSPNGDGINDYWIIENIDLYPENEVKVFDKSGRLIFNKKGYRNDWDGKVSGKLLQEDTYYYLIDFGVGQPKKKGFITMLNN